MYAAIVLRHYWQPRLEVFFENQMLYSCMGFDPPASGFRRSHGCSRIYS
jgi:hypothetical protein